MPAMARNAEVIRHWQMLLHIDAMRAGVSVQDLAAKFKVTTRTVWRDLQALQEVGFPLVDEKRDRTTCWKLLNMPLKALNDAGLSVTEACSLYLSRTLLVEFTGTPFEPGLAAIIRRVEKSLSPAVRKFLQRLPEVVQVKGAPRKNVISPKHDEFVARLIEAATERKVCRVLYFSVHSDREKEYELHPYSLTYAEGGLYLSPGCPNIARCGVRRRARPRVTVLESRSRPGPTWPTGVRAVAGREPRRQAREDRGGVLAARRQLRASARGIHRSRSRAIAGGGVRLTLKVCRDWALRTWVLAGAPTRAWCRPRRWRKRSSNSSTAPAMATRRSCSSSPRMRLRRRADACRCGRSRYDACGRRRALPSSISDAEIV
jgi:hypothetical protein